MNKGFLYSKEKISKAMPQQEENHLLLHKSSKKKRSIKVFMLLLIKQEAYIESKQQKNIIFSY